MPGSSIETTVTFRHPFVLRDFDVPQPAGTYRLVTDEEEIGGLSFLASRSTATWLHLPALAISALASSVVSISTAELDAALAADRRADKETPHARRDRPA